MVGDVKTLVRALDGAPIEREDTTGWIGFFAGNVTIHNLIVDDDQLHFDLCFPTTPQDLDDYIWSSERQAGTTEKVRLILRGRQINARVVRIARRGADPRWDDQGPEEYCLTFEVPRHLSDARAHEPLQVLFVWRRDEQEVVLATAKGAV